jgi:hypothetical protein
LANAAAKSRPPVSRSVSCGVAGAERRLMAAVLHTVVEDCRGTSREQRIGRVPARDQRHLQQARVYASSTDRSWPYSFENICEALDVEPRRLRRLLDVAAARRPTPLRAR